jgi:hypothetical protein
MEVTLGIGCKGPEPTPLSQSGDLPAQPHASVPLCTYMYHPDPSIPPRYILKINFLLYLHLHLKQPSLYKMHDRIPSPVRPSNSSLLRDGDLATLPPGWSRGTTSSGQTFYIDHNSRTTSFRHPCWRDDKPDAKGRLPRGWEMREGEDGRCYFLDHNLHRCVWEDPRDGVERGEGEGRGRGR